MTKKNNQSLVNKTGREIRVFSDFKLKEQRSEDGSERQEVSETVVRPEGTRQKSRAATSLVRYTSIWRSE